MLFPSKHSHPDQTVLAVAVVMLRYLARRQVVSFDDLMHHCEAHSRSVEYLFTPAVTLLYALGLVEYLPKVDSFHLLRAAQ